MIRCPWILSFGASLMLGVWILELLFRLIPHPIFRRLQWMLRIILQGMGEIVAGGVAVNEKDRRDESLAVICQLVGGHHAWPARVVPMIIVYKPERRRLV